MIYERPKNSGFDCTKVSYLFMFDISILSGLLFVMDTEIFSPMEHDFWD